jgi:RHS repeat-associated protein
MEKNEASFSNGDGNSYTTEFRQYDPRLGRWLSLDPMMMEFPEQSPFVAFDNDPISLIDPEGLEARDGGEPRDGDFTRSGENSGIDIGKREREWENNNGSPNTNHTWNHGGGVAHSDFKIMNKSLDRLLNQPYRGRDGDPGDCEKFGDAKRHRKGLKIVAKYEINRVTKVRDGLFDHDRTIRNRNFRRNINVRHGSLSVTLNPLPNADNLQIIDRKTGAVVQQTGMVAGAGAWTLNLQKGKYTIRVIAGPRRPDAYNISWIETEQRVKKTTIYLLLGFIPIRFNHQEIMTNSNRTPDTDIDFEGWKLFGKGGGKQRRREHRQFRMNTKASKENG